MQSGLLDILMSPDKYQELIQYHQAQNSIIFPSLHHAAYQIDALNPRLPTWEFLQVGGSEMMLHEHYFNKGTKLIIITSVLMTAASLSKGWNGADGRSISLKVEKN